MIEQNCDSVNKNQFQEKVPILFISHGGPPTAFRDKQFHSEEENIQIYDKIVNYGLDLQKKYKIKAIVVVSAHYDKDDFSIVSQKNPKTIHDHGFNEYFKYTLNAFSDLAIVNKIKEEFEKAQIKFKSDDSWGYDHGCFNSVKMLFTQEKIEIPVINLSLKSSFSVQEHIEFAQVLRKLREENDYLIVASGSSSHNLRDLFTSMHSGKPSIYTKQYEAFENQLFEIAVNQKGSERINSLLNIKKSKEYKINHPSDEHFFPFIVAAAAASDLKGNRFQYYNNQKGLVMSSYEFI